MTSPSSTPVSPALSSALSSALSTALLKAAAREGRPCPASVSLDSPDVCFVAVDGPVDVFAVPLRDGFSTGQRSHLARIAAGGLLFGMPPQERGSAVLLVAVCGVGARLLALPTTRVRELAVAGGALEEASGAIDGWVEALSVHFSARKLVDDARALEAGPRIDVEAGTTLRVVPRVLWTRVTPDLRFVDQDAAPWTTVTAFPLVRDACLVAGAPLQVVGMLTPAWLRADVGLGALRFFHELLLRELADTFVLRERTERTWLERKEQRQAAVVAQSLARLAALEPSRDAGPDDAHPPDVAERVLRRVALAAGIVVRSHPRKPDEGLRDYIDGYARAHRFRTREVLLRGAWWQQDGGPLLARRAQGGALVALLPDSPGSYMLDDGGDVRVRVDAQVAAALMPIASVLFRPLPDRVDLRSLARFLFAGTRSDLAFAVFAGGLSGIFGTLLPLATGHIFDVVVPMAQRSALVQVGVGLMAFSGAAALLDITRAIALVRLETKTSAALEASVWDRLLSLPATFFRKFSVGDLQHRTQGIDAIRRELSGAALTSLASAVFAIWNVLLLYVYDVRLALIGTALALLAGAIALVVGAIQLARQRQLSAMEGRLRALTTQLIAGIAKLRVSASESRAFARWAQRFGDQRALEYTTGRIENGMTLFQATFPVVVSVALFSLVARAPAGTMSTGTFLAFQASLGAYIAALMGLIQTGVRLLRVVPLLERARPIFEATPETTTDKASPGTLLGDIEVSHISFRYDEGQAPILDDVTFSIRPGESVAIVGPSGSGKSTLLRILLGFEKPSAGAVYYSGQDLDSVDPREVRRQLGVVLQTNSLMAGSIADNVAGANRLPQDQLWDALDQAALADEVRAMPMGLHTVLQQGGGGLSGGQRQRLLIARALATRPRMLFLDEATSALDATSQAAVMRAIDRLRVTRIMIAHRLSTIRNADRIIVLERGRIVQQGSFDELVAQPGAFRELAQRQML